MSGNGQNGTSLERFERQVHSGQHDEATHSMLCMLEGVGLADALPRFVGAPEGLPITLEQVATRIGAAVVALAARPSYALSQRGLVALSVHKQELETLFWLGGFDNIAFVKYSLGALTPEGAVDFDEDAMTKLLGFATIESLDEVSLAALPRLRSETAMALLLGFLAQSLCLTWRAEANRQQLLRLGPLLERAMLPDSLAMLACKPWMLCSYSDAPDKHDIKRHINTALQRWMHAKGIRPARMPTRAGKGRPTLLVALEHFRTEHAMYRCYAPILTELRRRFRLVAVVPGGEIDPSGRAIFDEVVELPGHFAPVGEIVGRVVAQRPDVMFFPSVGMVPWTVWLANLRLAPLQVMMGGHPATSASEHIDFFILRRGVGYDPACFTERIVELDATVLPHAAHPELSTIEPVIRERPEVLRIGVPANALKLGPRFLATCRAVAERASRPLEFHFFPNTRSIATRAIERRIRAWLPAARVHARSSYAEYLARLNECDIALGTYPFGASNSAVDALLLCIPWVCWDGPELHAGSEQSFLRQAGLPEWLIAPDQERYIEAAVRLIEDDEGRNAIAMRLSGRARELLYGEDAGRAADEFADAMHWLHANRDAIVRDGRKVWTPSARAAWAPGVTLPA